MHGNNFYSSWQSICTVIHLTFTYNATYLVLFWNVSVWLALDLFVLHAKCLTLPMFGFICISPGIMLLILNRSSGYVPLKILSIEDGTILKDFKHLLHRNKKVDFIEQFNEKLLVKQENENLQILDVSYLFSFSVSIFQLGLLSAPVVVSSLCRFDILVLGKLAELTSWHHQHLSFCMKTSCS